MAEILKTPKDIRINRLRAKANEGDDYQEYMQAVLRQAKAYPEKSFSVRTH